MNTQAESGNLNGSATLYLMIGEIRSDVKHLRTDLQGVSVKVERLEQQRSSPLPLRDLGGFLFAAAVVLLAIAGKWALLGELVHGYGR